MTSSETTFNDKELIARLRSQIGDDVQQVYDHEALFRLSADRIEQLVATNEALTEQLAAARHDAKEAEAYAEELEDKLSICERHRDAYAEMDRIGAQAVRDLEAKLALMTTERDEAWKRAAHSEKMWGEAETKLAKAVEALEALIHLAHDCEKELTEDLHHMDFCGESEPLTKARATLAEIKGESHE